MSSKMPPVPPESLSPKGPKAEGGRADVSAQPRPGPGAAAGEQTGQKADPDKMGQAANTTINTTHQGLQQDR